jgi:hydroxyacylglutathione hydrolase
VAGARVVAVVDEGLGNSAYLADLGEGQALAVDAPRDLRAMRTAARKHGLKVAFAADTHLHADFLSGARQLAADNGAQILAPAAGARVFDHLGLADGDEVDLGGLTLRAWATPPGAERTTTIGREKTANPLLAVPGEDAFVRVLLASLGTFPPYFLRLPEENRRGPAIVACPPALPPLTADRVRALRDGGGQVIDVRPVADYAAGHIPGSLAIALRDAFVTWLGWLVPDPATPLVIVAGPGQDLAEVAWQALKIGYGNLAGTLASALPAWEAAGNRVAVTRLLAPGQVDPAAVVDVRQAGEYAGGHLPGARNIELGALSRQAPGLAGRPVVVMCGHGERAATAASVLERMGHAGVAVLPGGPPDWSAATGMPLESSA